MLVLHANRELEMTFNKLIETMGAKIAWNGRFVAIDNQLILEGTVRSLFFQFDTKKVSTNLIELPDEEDKVIEVSKHSRLQDLLNMILYAFGKWGTLKGLHVEQDYAQLNQLFAKILRAYYIEPAFQRDNFRFYKEGMRITYEEVLEIALQSEEKPEEAPEEWEEEAQGLWHKLIWKNRERVFKKVETTLIERQKDRIGHNFYLVGYQCPKCSEKLHMAVYPVGKELRIETEEKGVFMARAYTCNKCNCFYTPRPDRLLSEGYIYEMAFGDDTKAYEDYLELLGRQGERTANFKFNEYEAARSQRLQDEAAGGQADMDHPVSPQEALRQMEYYSQRMDSLPEDVFQRFTHRIEDGFYPDIAVAKHERKIQEQIKKRRGNQTHTDAPKPKGTVTGRSALSGRPAQFADISKNQEDAEYMVSVDDPMEDQSDALRPDIAGRRTQQTDMQAGQEPISGQEAQLSEAANKDFGSNKHAGSAEERVSFSPQGEKYHARIGVWERLSDRQRAELERQIQNDASMDEQERQALLRPIEQAKQKKRAADITKKVDGCQDRNYAQIHKVLEEVDQAEVSEEVKRPLLERLRGLLKRRGTEEVRQMMEKLPQRLDRAGYKELERKLKGYEDVDLSPYQETLRQKREEAEKQEISNMVKRARKVSRGDYVSLMARLEAQEFADENVAPYMEKIQEKLKEMDEQLLDEICGSVQQMDFDEAAAAYEQIAQESFLPELKGNALEMLSRRLEKIRTDECELLVHKLQEEMQESIQENPRHHFYPARKVMLKTAEPEETRVIDRALASYAGGRGLYEYPIMVADTSRNQSGKEGMILTPENLFYSTRLSAYGIPISSIDSINASTGLLNRKITLEEKNGAKHKLPYVVGTDEMKDWAEILEDFIQYLQEKPASRKLTYLAKEKHDTICCFRCGCVYQSGDVCPDCGYKMNH